MAKQCVHIIGAGLCGSLLSIILARRGFDVSIIERQADPRSSTVAAGRSINLAMSARGIRALRHAGVLQHIKPLLIGMKGRLIHQLDGSTELQPYGQDDDEQIYSVSRTELNRILIGIAEKQYRVRIQFQHEVVSYYPNEATLRVRDQQKQADYDLDATPIIAADGAGSVIRRAFHDSTPIDASESLLEHGYKELAIPAGPDGEYQLEAGALHVWPRGEFMLIALANPGGDFTLTLFMPNDGASSFSTIDTDKKIDEFFKQQFPDAAPLIPELVQNFKRNPVGILGTVRCKHWHDGENVLLIGDAAHAVVPFHGQGMNLAFEDCVVLDKQLDIVSNDWALAFQSFESAQLANANAIADMALENYVEMRDTVRDAKHGLRQELAFELERRSPNHFIPRYSMVMFHDEIPYAVAQRRGAIQKTILDELTKDVESLAQIDFALATSMVEQKLKPL